MDFGRLKFWSKQEEPLASQESFLPQTEPVYTPNQDPYMTGNKDPFSNQTFSSLDGMQESFNQRSAQYPVGVPFPGSTPQPAQPPQQWEAPMQQEASVGLTGREVELILAKLDAIRSEIDALHQRVRRIEQATEPPTNKRYW